MNVLCMHWAYELSYEPQSNNASSHLFFLHVHQRYKYRVLQTIQMKLILLCVWAEPAALGSSRTALKFKYDFKNRLTHIKFNVCGRVEA